MSNATAPKLTIDQLRAFTRNPEVIATQRDLVAARVTAKMVRSHVDAYIAPVFAQFAFYNDREVEHGEPKQRITSPKNLYLSKDEAGCATFFAACDEAHRANGYTVPAGYCPALVAENRIITLENALLKLASDAFGQDFTKAWGDLRKKAVELFSNSPR